MEKEEEEEAQTKQTEEKIIEEEWEELELPHKRKTCNTPTLLQAIFPLYTNFKVLTILHIYSSNPWNKKLIKIKKSWHILHYQLQHLGIYGRIDAPKSNLK
jgi:hypothetical protein